MVRFILCLLVCLLALVGTASAATYYVAPNGSDASSGTQAAPWQTVGKVNSTTFNPGDAVLFQGGSTFSDNTLMPRSSGTADGRISFGSYGKGHATIAKGVWIGGEDFLTFQNLTFNATFQGGSDSPLYSDWITLKGNTITFPTGSSSTHLGIYSNGNGWLILNNVVKNIGNSGMILNGDGYTIDGNTVTSTGICSCVTYGTHAIYLRVSNAVVTNNTFSKYHSSGVSMRFHNTIIADNTFTGGPFAITMFPFDTTVGYSRFLNNTITGTTTDGIYVNGGSGGSTPLNENMIIAYNVIRPAAGDAMSLETNQAGFDIHDNP